jgi:hypothetical protein
LYLLSEHSERSKPGSPPHVDRSRATSIDSRARR